MAMHRIVYLAGQIIRDGGVHAPFSRPGISAFVCGSRRSLCAALIAAWTALGFVGAWGCTASSSCNGSECGSGGLTIAGSGGGLSGAPASATTSGSGMSATANGGMTVVTGATANSGAMAVGGSSSTASTTPQAGATTVGGGGTPSSGGTGGTGPVVDQKGVPLAKPGDSKTGSKEYLNFGDFRLLLNKWGSDELGCNTSMKIFVNNDKSFGWSFDRGACGGAKEKPDYPEIEFGIHPFGAGSSLATSPSFPSTTVLPLQIKDITSASVILDSMNVSIQKATTWNVNFELWLSQKNPVADANPGAYAELIAFWGWQDGWACDKSGIVIAGDKSYSLCHQSDTWANGQWRYFQFRADGGSSQSFSGKIDVKVFLDWLVNNYNFSKDLWVTRFEVGTEIDDNTSGTVTLKNITFQVNGTSKSAQFAQ